MLDLLKLFQVLRAGTMTTTMMVPVPLVSGTKLNMSLSRIGSTSQMSDSFMLKRYNVPIRSKEKSRRLSLIKLLSGQFLILRFCSLARPQLLILSKGLENMYKSCMERRTGDY